MIVIVQDFVQLLSFTHEAYLNLKLCLILGNNYIKLHSPDNRSAIDPYQLVILVSMQVVKFFFAIFRANLFSGVRNDTLR